MFKHLEKIKSLAIVGATGLVGREFLDLLDEYKIRIPKVKLLASERSVGMNLEVNGELQPVEVLDKGSFKGIEVAFFSATKAISKAYIPSAVEAGALVVDDSSLYRLDKSVPLVVPQVNGESLSGFKGLIMATPNCTTTPLAVCLKPLQEAYGLKRVVVSTYQAVTGAGSRAAEELSHQTAALMNGQDPKVEVFPQRIAFNCLPMVGEVQENGNTDEEEKIIHELRKILGLTSLKIASTAIRVPTFVGHGLSVNVELEKDFDDIKRVRELLESSPGVRVVDQPAHGIFPTNEVCTKSNETFVGRVRRDSSVPYGLNLWVMTDNLRKGAALNVLETLDVLYGYRV